MLDHIASHGVQNPEESLIVSNDSSRKDECEDDGMGNTEDGNISDTADSSLNKTDSGAGGDEVIAVAFIKVFNYYKIVKEMVKKVLEVALNHKTKIADRIFSQCTCGISDPCGYIFSIVSPFMY